MWYNRFLLATLLFVSAKKNTLELSWKGEDDPQEPSARPREYIVYTRIGYGGFDNGTLVSKSSYTVKIEPGLVYSFKVTAANRGGESFLLKYSQPTKQNVNVKKF